MIPKKKTVSKSKTVAPQKGTSKAQPRRIKVNTAKRQQSEELARASESLLRAIAENYPNSYISIIEKDLTIGYTAGQEFKKLNLDPNQFVGLTLEQVFGKHTPLVRENYLKTFGGVETQFEIFINNQHQLYRTVPLRDQAGRITRILAVVENVTERKRAEEALRFSEERYRNFIGQSFEAISRTEFDHPIDITLPVEKQIDRIYENAYMAECNQAMADMYRVPSPEAFVGMRLIDAHGGKDNPVNRETFRKLIENGYRSVNDETMEYTVDGKLIWFLSNTIGTVENGYLVRLWGSAIDITARKQAEEKLRESEERLRLTTDNLPNSYVYQANYNDEGQIQFLYISNGVAQLHGVKAEELVADRLIMLEQIEQDQIPAMMEANAESFRTMTDFAMDLRYRLPDGEQRWLHARSRPHRNEKGQVIWHGSVTDITERKRTEEALRESEALYDSLVNQLPQNLYRIDRDGKVLFVNKTFQQNLGAPLEDILGKSAYDDFYPDDRGNRYRAEDAQVIASGKSLTLIDVNKSPVTGQVSYNEGIKIPVFDKDGEVCGIQGIFYDITERKQAEEKLRASEERFRSLITSAPDAVFMVDEEGKITFANMEATNLLGYALDEFSGMDVEKLIPQKLRESHIVDRTKYMGDPRTRLMGAQPNLIALHKDGSEIPVDIKLSPIQTEAGFQVIAFMRDITERKRAESELRAAHETLQTQFYEINALKETLQEQVIRDPLTHLHNRRYLDEALGHEAARARRENYPIGIMLIDIDHFKEFNDIYGHFAGDEVLRSLSRLLVDSIRQGDIACRYGGEEFLVVMIGAYEADVERRAEAICRDFSRLRIRFDKQELSATISIGVAFYPRHGAEIQQVIGAADAAMYQGKQAGRNCVQVWHNL